MAKRIDDSTRIAKEITVQDWKDERIKLIRDILQDRHSPLLWEKAYDYFYQRISSRFLNPIGWIIKKGQSEGEGFSAVALQCILIEFIESFYQGKIYTTSSQPRFYEYNSSVRLFIDFLMNHYPFSNYFKMEKSARGFYDNIRCGLLHEASTKETSLIRVNSPDNLMIELIDDNKNMIVYRNNFLHSIKEFLSDYKIKLFQDTQLKINFIRKFDDICGIKRELYFAYGSNLDSEQLINRINKYHTAGKAILDGYKFTYNKRSKDGTAKANIIKSDGSNVHGICYEIDSDDLDELKKYEKGYNSREFKIMYDSIEINAFTYQSESFTDEKPSEEYRATIIKGAHDWKLDKEYIINNLS